MLQLPQQSLQSPNQTGSDMEYRHTQIGTVIISGIGIILVFILLRFFTNGSLHSGEVVAAFLLVLVLALFSSLSVEIKDNSVTCFFGPGLIRRTMNLVDITEVQSVVNPWFAGWGIRWMPGRCWLWNVSGLRAVELTLKNGKRFRIGTDEPESLVNAIQTNMQRAFKPI
jgi:hypothetical protein